ncbi:acyl-CoA dehydrogenase [Salinactinospora qingdaonensis]|uniref:Acyl-CoA dehydrogenase n=1 Tax=Salinactinospora qingdaonensis TaxID=702744 RepID=A0ABP7FAN5_9ACTN
MRADSGPLIRQPWETLRMPEPVAPGPGVTELDRALGDPWDKDNPAGFVEFLAADERAEMSAAGEAILDRYGFNAEFVPVALGGRFARMDRLIEVLRTVWRRDPCLGLGHGLSSFIAAVSAWTAGDSSQRSAVANLLLANRRVAPVYHEFGHDNDLSSVNFSATSNGAGWLLNGRKDLVTDVRRADAMVIFARTRPGLGSRNHGQFFVPKPTAAQGRVRYLPRSPSSGMRGVRLDGAEFTNYRIPGESLIGEPGQGVETALRSFQITRSALPGASVGILDTGLRTALSYVRERRRYGGAATDLPYVRAVIGRAFTDLLVVDAFSSVAARALHLLPGETGVLASAVKYLAPRVLMDAMAELSTVLGAHSHLREGRYAIFEKLARDLAPAEFGHASRDACRATILPQLPRLARRAWFNGTALPELFWVGGDLAPLRFSGLVTGAPGSDSLCAALVDISEHYAGASPLGRLADRFRDELVLLRAQCVELAPKDLSLDASPAAHAVVERYTLVLAAACCLGIWWHGSGHGVPFACDETWVTAALDRLNRRLGGKVTTREETRGLEESMFRSAVRRHDDGRLFDLTGREVPG